MSKLLILGGTQEGRALAEAIARAQPDLHLITSLAGATTKTPDLPGDVRVGGFGGVTGLVDYLKREAIDRVIDATHPFADTMTAHAVQACAEAHVPYLRLDRPAWDLPDTDVVFVPDAIEAARLVARTSSSAFLTIGRKDLAAFHSLGKVKVLVRAIEQPDLELDNATYITARPPFTLKGEAALMQAHAIDTLVTKASGGTATRAKLDAAAQVGARIVLLRRPPPPDAERVLSVEDAVKWITRQP